MSGVAFAQDAYPTIEEVRAAKELSRSDPEAALQEIERIVALLDGREDPTFIVEVTTAHLAALARSREYERAIQLAQNMEETLDIEAIPSDVRADYEAILGWAHTVVGNTGEAFTHYQTAHKLWSELGEDEKIARLFSYIASLYDGSGDIQQALSYYESAWDILKESPPSYAQTLVLNNWGFTLIESGSYEKALEVLLIGEALARELGNMRLVATCLENIGAAQVRLGRYEEAERTLNESIEIWHELDMPDAIADSLGSFARLEFGKGNLTEAAQYAERSLELNQEMTNLLEVRTSHALLAEIREAQGDTNSALFHLREFVRINEDISSTEARNRGAIANAELELVKRDREIEVLIRAQADAEKLLARERYIGVLTIFTVLLTTAALALMIVLYRTQKRAKSLADKRAGELAISEEKAVSASKSKSEFLASMSHEIRTPLNGVMGMTQALALEDLTDDQKDKVETILDSGKTLMALLNDALDLSKIEAGKLEIAPLPGDLKHSLNRLNKIWEQRALEKGLELILDIDESIPPSISFDAVRVRQCVGNMISNAIKFTQEGQVRVSVKAEKLNGDARMITIAVEDTGIGMNDEALGKLFKPFSQADASTTRRFGGTGLGLAITKKLSELMGGSVRVSSVEGKGSTFTVSFQADECPYEQSVIATGKSSKIKANAAKLEGRRILVVDDNTVNRQVVRLMLTQSNVYAVDAVNGQEALDALKAEAFDLVLMDVHMPVMDGIEAIKLIRASNEIWSSVPVIALTADTMSGDRERLLELGMNGYVSKPIDHNEFLTEMCRVLVTHESCSDASLPAAQTA